MLITKLKLMLSNMVLNILSSPAVNIILRQYHVNVLCYDTRLNIGLAMERPYDGTPFQVMPNSFVEMGLKPAIF